MSDGTEKLVKKFILQQIRQFCSHIAVASKKKVLARLNPIKNLKKITLMHHEFHISFGFCIFFINVHK